MAFKRAANQQVALQLIGASALPLDGRKRFALPLGWPEYDLRSWGMVQIQPKAA